MDKSIYQSGYAKMKQLKDSHRLEIVLQQLSQIQFSNDKIKILDIGCGDGVFTSEMGKVLRTSQLYGVDISKQAIKQAQLTGIDAKVIDLDKKMLPYKLGTFDLIFCGSMLEIVDNPDHLIKEMRRLVKSDGYVIVTVPNIGAWASRIMLMFGQLPFYYRISTKYQFPPLRQTFQSPSNGIIRLFTLSSIRKLLELHRLKVIATIGAREKAMPYPLSLFDRVMAKMPSLAFQLVIICTPNE